MTTMTLRINDEDSALIKNYIKLHNLSLSEFARQSMLERIEDDYDLAVLRKAMAEDNGVRIPAEDFFEEFGIWFIRSSLHKWPINNCES